jgi:hypothetical protein
MILIFENSGLENNYPEHDSGTMVFLVMRLYTLKVHIVNLTLLRGLRATGSPPYYPSSSWKPLPRKREKPNEWVLLYLS